MPTGEGVVPYRTREKGADRQKTAPEGQGAPVADGSVAEEEKVRPGGQRRASGPGQSGALETSSFSRKHARLLRARPDKPLAAGAIL